MGRGFSPYVQNKHCSLCCHLPWPSVSLGEYNFYAFLLLKEAGGDKREREESGAIYNLCKSCQYSPVCSGWTRSVCKVSFSKGFETDVFCTVCPFGKV